MILQTGLITRFEIPQLILQPILQFFDLLNPDNRQFLGPGYGLTL